MGKARASLVGINVLPPETAAKIAAGEVVERPASAAKELVENALDAGATRVDVEVRGGGVALLRVADNGCGMSPEDLPLAFKRYATSKIAGPEDLERVVSYGFRGEALPSIAAVAEVSVLTREAGAAAGTFLRVAGGEVLELAQRGAPMGTSVTVRKLFQNVPARLKFLRSDHAEAGRIATMLGQLALARPDVHFSLTVDGRMVLETSGDGDLKAAAVQVYGLEAAAGLVPVDWEAEDGPPVRVTGLTSPPEVSRSNRSYITLFVNRRLVQNRALVYAAAEAYRGLLMTGRYPISILDVAIDPAETDVNVHPTKAEVKFRDEGLAFGAVANAVRRALSAGGLARPSSGTLGEPPLALGGESEPLPEGPAFAAGRRGQAGVLDRPPAQRPGEGVHPEKPQDIAAKVPPPAQRPAAAPPPVAAAAALGLPILRPLGQVGRTYIVAEGPDGMYMIDQHAAHERVLFDRLREAGRRRETQALLAPATVELDLRRAGMLEQSRESLAACGFLLEPFGPRSVLVRGVPSGLRHGDPARALAEFLDDMERSDLVGYTREERALATAACHGAVRAGQDLSIKEMEEIARLLEKTAQPRTCPHGRPTVLHMSSAQLEREFGRR